MMMMLMMVIYKYLTCRAFLF